MNYDQEEMATLLSSIYGSQHGWEMVIRLGQALELTDALWALVPVVVAAGHEHDQITPADAADRSAAGLRLDASERAHVVGVADQLAAALDAAYEEAPIDPSKLAAVSPAELMADPYGIFGSLVDLPRVGAALESNLADLSTLSSDQVLYLRTYMLAKTKEPRTAVLLRALFVTVIGTLEPLVTRLVRVLLYRQAPQTSSLADLALDERSRRLCFGPPATWRRVLVEQLGVVVLDDLVDWARLGTLWEDRNLVLHRGGVVDERHSQKTGSVANTVLEFEAADVQSVVDEIAAARFALVAAIWDFLSPGMGTIAAEAGGAPIFDSLRSGRWRQAEGLSLVAEKFAEDDEAAATAKVNRWLAREAGLGAAVIRQEVEQWDVTRLPRTFQVARHILLHQDVQAIALIKELNSEGLITESDLTDWPLFDRLLAEGKLTGTLSISRRETPGS